MLLRVLQTRRASSDGVKVDLFLAGKIYDLPEDFVRRSWPDGTYELVIEDVKAIAPPMNKGRRKKGS